MPIGNEIFASASGTMRINELVLSSVAQMPQLCRKITPVQRQPRSAEMGVKQRHPGVVKVNDHSSEVSRDMEPCNVNNLNTCSWKPMYVFLLGFLKSS